MNPVIGIKLTAYKMKDGERNYQVNSADKTTLIEMYAGVTSVGAPIIWTEDQYKTKETFLRSQIGDYINHFQMFEIEFVTLMTYSTGCYDTEMTAAKDGVEA